MKELKNKPKSADQQLGKREAIFENLEPTDITQTKEKNTRNPIAFKKFKKQDYQNYQKLKIKFQTLVEKDPKFIAKKNYVFPPKNKAKISNEYEKSDNQLAEGNYEGFKLDEMKYSSKNNEHLSENKEYLSEVSDEQLREILIETLSQTKYVDSVSDLIDSLYYS